MSIRRTVTGLAEIGLAFTAVLPLHEALQNAGHEGIALLATLGGIALGSDGILRVGEGALGLPDQSPDLSPEELKKTDYYNRGAWG